VQSPPSKQPKPTATVQTPPLPQPTLPTPTTVQTPPVNQPQPTVTVQTPPPPQPSLPTQTTVQSPLVPPTQTLTQTQHPPGHPPQVQPPNQPQVLGDLPVEKRPRKDPYKVGVVGEQGPHSHVLIVHQPDPQRPVTSGSQAGMSAYTLEFIEPGLQNRKVEVYRHADVRELLYKDTIPLDQGVAQFIVIGTRNPEYVQ